MKIYEKILDAFKLESTKEIEREKGIRYDGVPETLLSETNVLFEIIKTTIDYDIFEESLAEVKVKLKLLSLYENEYDFPKGVPSKSLKKLDKNEEKLREHFWNRVMEEKEDVVEEAEERPKSKKKEKHFFIHEDSTLIYAAMCEKHAQEKDYMEKLGILEDYEDE